MNGNRSDALNELFLKISKISVPLENIPCWENDLFFWDFTWLEGKEQI